MAFSVATALGGVLAIVLILWIRLIILRIINRNTAKTRKQSFSVGGITLEELGKYCGVDPYRPLLVSLKGTIYDVTSQADFYGPGGGYHVFAGKELARALGKMAIREDECNDDTSDFTDKDHDRLQQWIDKFEAKYPRVGKVVPPMELTFEQLAQYDGSDPDKPILLAIKKTVFDVSKGRAFYGPDGAYPFGGRECARALAKFSTELSDCTDDLEDCNLSELDALRDWQAQFYNKYKLVGHVLPSDDSPKDKDA